MNLKYGTIMDLPHHVSSKHPHMTLLNRAAQFAPFAALSGYGDAIDEMARWTDAQDEPGEYDLLELDRRIRLLEDRLYGQPEIRIRYFEKDSKKNGGVYREMNCTVVRIDHYERTIKLDSGLVLSMDDIRSLEGAVFDTSEE